MTLTLLFGGLATLCNPEQPSSDAVRGIGFRNGAPVPLRRRGGGRCFARTLTHVFDAPVSPSP
jgi:hypothetical protein